MPASLIAFALVLPASWLAVSLVLRWLTEKEILDRPNERSSHSLPTPRGGGLAVTPLVLFAWAFFPLPGQWVVMAGAAALLLLSWRDDRASLPAGTRLALQAIAVAAGTVGLPPLFHGALPLWADQVLAGFLWLWFVNLFNFMDGIDGITGVETIGIAAGLLALGFAPAQNAVLIGASLGFLAWNWHPARIFLGDSGSVPLGYLLGWLLLSLAGSGQWAAALILPAYYLADATITLLKRASRGEKIWQAHRQHYYQQAVQGGASHAAVARLILGANLLLIGAAWWSQSHPVAALAAAAVVTAALLAILRGLGRRQRP
jgi:UDP-N-acetylmuramyl pentapeptide phosphotransferase/UDP-N-acetylglucosamine-1-phosphate transferase